LTFGADQYRVHETPVDGFVGPQRLHSLARNPIVEKVFDRLDN
jgi:hypothetical protein